MEDRPEYLIEAMELLHGEPSAEIEAPRQVTERRGGKMVDVERTAFVKLYTSFKRELKNLDGDALKVWIYLALSVNRHTKEANPGLRRIADETGMAVNTVRAKVEILDEMGLLETEKGAGKSTSYKPADYVSVSKFDTVGVSKNTGTVSKNEPTVSTPRRDFAQLEELELTKDTANAVPLESESWYQFEQAAKTGESWEGRENLLPQHLPLADWYHGATGQTCQKRVQKAWMRALADWYASGLTAADLQAAYDADIKWRGVFTSPVELTAKAIALKAAGSAKPDKKDYTRQLWEG